MNESEAILNIPVACCDVLFCYLQRSISKPKQSSEQLLSPSVNMDSPLESSMEEYDEKGWLDYNPEAKLHLSHLDKEEDISDDETEVMPLFSLRICAF